MWRAVQANDASCARPPTRPRRWEVANRRSYRTVSQNDVLTRFWTTTSSASPISTRMSCRAESTRRPGRAQDWAVHHLHEPNILAPPVLAARHIADVEDPRRAAAFNLVVNVYAMIRRNGQVESLSVDLVRRIGKITYWAMPIRSTQPAIWARVASPNLARMCATW